MKYDYAIGVFKDHLEFLEIFVEDMEKNKPEFVSLKVTKKHIAELKSAISVLRKEGEK